MKCGNCGSEKEELFSYFGKSCCELCINAMEADLRVDEEYD